MAKERRPLSCDIWNRPWPPKYTKGPLKKYGPDPVREKSPDEDPLPRPTRENWLALVLGGISCALAFAWVVSDQWGLTALPLIPYVLLVALGAFRVRPRAQRGLAFFLWFLPVLLQLAIYALFFREMAATALGNRPYTPQQDAFMMAASAAFFTGWIPAIGLQVTARRGTLLLVAGTVGPFLTLILMAILIVPLA